MTINLLISAGQPGSAFVSTGWLGVNRKLINYSLETEVSVTSF